MLSVGTAITLFKKINNWHLVKYSKMAVIPHPPTLQAPMNTVTSQQFHCQSVAGVTMTL